MEAAYAFVVRDPGAMDAPDPESLRGWCAERLAGYKVPKYVDFLEGDLPRNDLGKVLKHRLRDVALQHLPPDERAGRRA